MAYFRELNSCKDDNIDFAVIDHFLEMGADINATCQSTGESIMHTVAAQWDKSVADYLLQRGVNAHIKDKAGRIPLHAAAITDHIEMIEWLADQGAELGARTNMDKQSPLHYAARYDSIMAIKTLVEKGGMYVLWVCVHAAGKVGSHIDYTSISQYST